MAENNKRTRMNVSITEKGKAQWDVTAEYETPEETDRNLREAITRIRAAVKDAGLAEAGEGDK
jgi:tripartite-type tricarboxylate transporter receptor subunit TctC